MTVREALAIQETCESCKNFNGSSSSQVRCEMCFAKAMEYGMDDLYLYESRDTNDGRRTETPSNPERRGIPG